MLERTPGTLRAMLSGLPDPWLEVDEGPDTWSPRQVVAHLIVGEETDWIPRARRILEHGVSRPFEPFDRGRHLREYRGTPLPELLDRFERLRGENLTALRGFGLRPDSMAREGAYLSVLRTS